MQHLSRFYVRQKITLMVNRYEIRAADAAGNEGEMIAFAQQKRMSFKEQVTFYADESKTEALFSFKARHGLDVRAEHDVFDQAGTAIGWFKKDFGASLLRSTWHVRYSGVEVTGQERSQGIAILRRIWDFIPFLGEVWIPFVFHFDFVDKATGETVMSSQRQISVRDRYTIDVPDERLDFRLAASLAVALDALQSR
ncbi:MAG TPA: hypothetical protein VLB85_03645 [Acidimicrobiia bacterium]|nr:hypothetical protein [Acidimicrobiia bacterium]